MKREANHWWLLLKIAVGVNTWGIKLVPWNDKLAGRRNVQHLCGESCVVAAVSSCMRDNGKEAANGAGNQG